MRNLAPTAGCSGILRTFIQSWAEERGLSEFVFQRPDKLVKDRNPSKRAREGEATGDSGREQTSTVDSSPMASESTTNQPSENRVPVPTESYDSKAAMPVEGTDPRMSILLPHKVINEEIL